MGAAKFQQNEWRGTGFAVLVSLVAGDLQGGPERWARPSASWEAPFSIVFNKV